MKEADKCFVTRFDSRSISIHDDVETMKFAMNYDPFFVIIFKSLVRLPLSTRMKRYFVSVISSIVMWSVT